MHHRIRASRWLTGLALAALITIATSCKKKGGDGGPPIAPTTTASTDHFLFARLNAKELRNSPIFAELKNAFVKQGELKVWDEFEKQIADQIGVRPSNLESVTVVMPEMPEDGHDVPPVMIMMVAETPIPKQMLFRKPLRESPDHPGYYIVEDRLLAHFPDPKILVLLHPSLLERYQGGYARDRTAWPLNADLAKASQEHTLYAKLNPGKLPVEARKGREVERFLPLFEAKSAVLAIDLRGKEFNIGLTGTFPNAQAASAAESTAKSLLAEAASEVASAFKAPRQAADPGPFEPLLKEAHRALKDATVTVSGSELSVATRYKAEFNVGEIVKAAVEKVRVAAARSQAMNHLKQIGLAIHNYASASADGTRIPVFGFGKNGEQVRTQIGPKGDPIYNPKPLLSWRVAILPYIEQGPLYNQFKLDEPWDSEHNKKLIDKMPKIYAPITKSAKPGMTHLQQVIGPQCMLPGRFNFGNMPDGTSNTIAVIEAAEPVIWTKPDDVYFSEMKFDAPPPKDLKKKFGGLFDNGFHVLMFDGSVRFIDSRRISDQTLWDALRPADGNVLGSDW